MLIVGLVCKLFQAVDDGIRKVIFCSAYVFSSSTLSGVDLLYSTGTTHQI